MNTENAYDYNLKLNRVFSGSTNLLAEFMMRVTPQLKMPKKYKNSS